MLTAQMTSAATDCTPSFCNDVAAVGDDGREPDLQPVGDLFVQQTLSDERQHFRFAYGEQVGGRSAVLSGKGHGRVGALRLRRHSRSCTQSFFAARRYRIWRIRANWAEYPLPSRIVL